MPAITALVLAALPAHARAEVPETPHGAPPAAAGGKAPAAAPSGDDLATPAVAGPPFCQGDYADGFSRLAPRARELEKQPYSFCVRNTATYECLSYGPDGNQRRRRKQAVLHGTAFAYRAQNGETLLLTNEHVAEWPAVTDADHPVEDVPAGCKRIEESIRLVDDESDDYAHDDIPLTRVVADPQLDAAVLKAKTMLPVLPWKIGHSAVLRERNVVEVRGFPLGAFRATNVGKVVSAYDHDDYKDWDHDDFVIDALLSEGNSGSPVLAVSCKTGELQLVGIYHAAYSRGSALNVVVGIDQLRDLMSTLKRSPRPHSDAAVTLDAETRERLVRAAQALIEPFFPFGSRAAVVRMRTDGTPIFELFAQAFPLVADPILAFEDLAGGDGWAGIGAIWFGGTRGMKRYARSDLDADTQAQVTHLADALRRDAVAFFDWRVASGRAAPSRRESERLSRLQRALARTAASRSDLAQLADELADRFAPQEGERGHALADVFALPEGSAAAQAVTKPPAPRNDAPAAGTAGAGASSPPGATPPAPPVAATRGAPPPRSERSRRGSRP